MKRKTLQALALLVILALASALTVHFIVSEKQTPSKPLRVACVGDSLTQSTAYPYDLWMRLGTQNFTVENFGAGGTTVSLESETPYMNTTVFEEALRFQPNIVIIMLGTNDAQPSLYRYNTSFVQDYVKLIGAFQALDSRPQIWIVLPPPIFSNQSGRIDPEYFSTTIIPDIKQAANETNLPTIDVYSALLNYSADFPDGVHPNDAAAEVIAQTIYENIWPQTNA